MFTHEDMGAHPIPASMQDARGGHGALLAELKEEAERETAQATPRTTDFRKPCAIVAAGVEIAEKRPGPLRWLTPIHKFEAFEADTKPVLIQNDALRKRWAYVVMHHALTTNQPAHSLRFRR